MSGDPAIIQAGVMGNVDEVISSDDSESFFDPMPFDPEQIGHESQAQPPQLQHDPYVSATKASKHVILAENRVFLDDHRSRASGPANKEWAREHVEIVGGRSPTIAQAHLVVEEQAAPVPTNGSDIATTGNLTPLDTTEGSFVNHPSESRCTFATKRPRTTMCVALLLVFVAIFVVIIVVVKPTWNVDSPTPTPISNEHSATPTTLSMSALQTIRDKGYIECGVTNQDGYSTNESVGYWAGFEVDICRAIAAAIFGKDKFALVDDPFVDKDKRLHEPVRYKELIPKERFKALKNENIDVLLAATSQTMERTVHESETESGYTFSAPYLVNELVFAGNKTIIDCLQSALRQDFNLSLLGECMDYEYTICILSGTTHLDVLDYIDIDHIDEIKTNAVEANDMDDFYTKFTSGRCTVMMGEKLDLSELHLNQYKFSTEEYVIGEEVYSREFISLVTRDGDTDLLDFGNWIIQYLLSAEQGYRLQDTDAFGAQYKTMFDDAESVVGHYGTMYGRHLEKFVTRSSANYLNNGTSPLMFAMPFGNTRSTSPPATTVSPTLLKVMNDEKLLCGINRVKDPFFASLNDEGTDWKGFEVDFCKAFAFSLFGVYNDKVKFIEVDTDDRFDKLRRGDIDVLVRATTITLERDAKKNPGDFGLTFSFPYFFDSIKYAGHQDFVDCAEKGDQDLGECADLKLCVTRNTTQADLVNLKFDRILFGTNSDENLVALEQGLCNVLVSGSVDTSIAGSQAWFRERGFVVGNRPLSQESLALVTRDDDPLWSKFASWLVAATIYAEERNVTDYILMPMVNLFGPAVKNNMLQDLIRFVGNYGEIWKKNRVNGVQREGRNLLADKVTDNLLRSDFWDIQKV